MWLLDANIDVHLLEVLKTTGIQAETTKARGWQALANGDLVSVATESGFVCIVTQDRLFAESAGKALKKFPQFAVVVIHLPQKPWRQYIDAFQMAWKQSSIYPVPGQVVHWP